MPAKMEEVNHDISVDVEVEEMETVSVNIYGSPVAPRGQRNKDSLETASHAVPLANANRVVSQRHICLVNMQDNNSFFFLMAVFHSKYFVATDLFL